jgi:competence protein ComEC
MTTVDNTTDAVGMERQKWIVRAADAFMADRNRWFLWVPVLMGGGSAGYFALPIEPTTIQCAVPLAAGSALWLLAWRMRLHLAICVWVASLSLIALGATAARVHTVLVDAPILARSTGPVIVTGRIAETELADLGPRVVLDHVTIGDMPLKDTPHRIRLRLTKYSSPPEAGSDIEVRAVLMPPPGPAEPGAHDFRRDSFFEGIGGVGYAVGRPTLLDSGGGHPVAQWIERRRQFIAGRVSKAMGASPEAAIATAYLTGERGLIDEQTATDMRNSGLAHLLAISGMKVGLVAVLVFGLVRILLGLMPALALRVPVRKIAAVIAIAAAISYTGLAAAPIPALRSVLMSGMAMMAILFDRQSFSLRLAAIAAIIVTLLLPDSVVSVSFQMSFGAVVALISFYEAFRHRIARHARHAGPVRRITVEFAKIVIMTLIATLVTAPLALIHFQQEANYSIPANALAIPLNDFWIMPLAFLGLALMPFGLDQWPLKGMGQGIHTMLAIARDVSAWPGAVSHAPILPDMVLIIGGFGVLWILLWRGRWRKLGIIPVVASAMIAVALPMPSPLILVSEDAGRVAVRQPDGTLAVSKIGKRDFTVDSWNRLNGSRGVAPFPDQGARTNGILTCDDKACLYKGLHGVIAILNDPAATEEICAGAALVISRWPIQADCGNAKIIDPASLSMTGAVALIDGGADYEIRSASAITGERPWGLARSSISTGAAGRPDGPGPLPDRP